MIQLRREPLAPPCSINVENAWGPQVHGCGTDFDLTLLFQEVILFIGPLGIAICLAVWRIWQLVGREEIVASPLLHRLKFGGHSLLTLLQTTLLVIQAALQTSLTRATIAASYLGVIGSVILLVASHFEHGRSVRASTLMLLYLGFSTPVDAMRARTLWSMPRDNIPVASVFTAMCVCKLVLLFLEGGRKTMQPGIHQPTPDEQAGIVSRAFLWWLVPLFSLGRKTSPLTSKALPDIEPQLTRPCEGQGDDGGSLSKPSIFHHLFAVRGWLLMSAIPPRLCYTGFLFAQPFLVERATEFMSEPLNPNTYKVGAGLISAYAIVYSGIAVTQAFYRQCTARLITAVRADLVTKIYSHTLNLSSSSSSRDATSTLMSADVERFAAGSRNMHECWACIVEVALGVWILEQQLGVAVAATGGLTATFVGLTIAVLPLAGKRQSEWLKGLEMRIAATTRCLQAMKGVKMTGVESTIRRDLIGLRKVEVRKLRQFRYILLIVAWAAWIPVIIAPILGFTLYSVVFGPRTGRILTTAVVYRCLTIFGLFGNSVATLIESSINLFTAVASLQRIQSFIHGDNTRLDNRVLLSSHKPPPDEDEDEDGMPLLPRRRRVQSNNQIRMHRLSRALTRAPAALRLTQASAGWDADRPLIVHDANLEVSSPSVIAVVGPTGSGKTTLLQMLLGEIRCALGSVTLSSLRIGYCGQTPWLTHESVRNNIVGPDIFEKSWYNAVIRATALDKDIRAMAFGDNTIIGNEGSSLSGGQKKRIALARAIYTRAPIVILDDPFNGLDGRTETAILEAVLGRQGLLRRQKTLVVWATSTVQQVQVADRVISLTDTGNIRKRGSLLMAAGRMVVPQGDESGDDDESAGAGNRPLSTLEVVQGIVTMPQNSSWPDDTHATASNPEYWIVRWAESNAISPNRLQGFYIGLYFAIGTIELIAWTGAAFFFIVSIAEKSADRCHAVLLDTVLRAPMSFFDSTAAGEIINRFSQDLQLIDTELPYDLLGTVTQIMIVAGNCGIIIYGSPWSGLAIPVVGVAVYFLQRAYLPTSRQLRVLEIEAKAPLFSHFLETLNGLATIRALRWTAAYSRRNLEAIKISQKPFYLLFAAQNWLNLVLDLITAGLAVTIMCVGVATRSDANSTIGLALFSATVVGASAKQLIAHWTKLEISMAAVERVRAFTEETASEEHPGSKSTAAGDPKTWHGKGSIEFRNVSARYSSSSPLVLRNISFDIQPGQRYAICGRTGSGKSTLLAILLRVINPQNGTILVDDADISQMKPGQVRSRFITLPQEPVLIGGTVRHNMKLYEPDCGDREMIAALNVFGLWDTIRSKGGLDVPLTEELLSHGQRQLFCFARSTLQKGNIVILDEPSSQSDRAIEQKMESAIRERFKSHTVLCIAHRLSTILSFDTVIVMDAGSIAESGNPRALLQDHSSLFSTLMKSQRGQDERA
ncbi:Uncharacterized protein BP5553_05690 [Venustampulla echinocandica]|uniref:P-loop containing nucleoside triphosphate hydrolase n=1 Tax=Venustampulla echinocandica TaxID=2656787 RepID=A0A370TLD0_9HELO|nr:Uncharacterized protein BP5553_05690 [Venustampulla echinocandica]RDL36338.1 Uncharacterized protein BP5553_05690 [Venustampulla echinocandica]